MRVHKVITIAAALALTATHLVAQDISIGAKAGPSFATQTGDGISEVGTRTGLQVGAFADIGITPAFSLQPEALFVQKGFSVEDDTGTGSLNLSYIQIPVLAKFSLVTTGALTPYVYAGPAVSFEVGCALGGESQGSSVEIACDELSENTAGFLPDLQTKAMDIGLIGGVGASFDVGTGAALLDVRYDFGLTSIDDAGEDDGIKNRAFSVTVGYSISLGM